MASLRRICWSCQMITKSREWFPVVISLLSAEYQWDIWSITTLLKQWDSVKQRQKPAGLNLTCSTNRSSWRCRYPTFLIQLQDQLTALFLSSQGNYDRWVTVLEHIFFNLSLSTMWRPKTRRGNSTQGPITMRLRVIINCIMYWKPQTVNASSSSTAAGTTVIICLSLFAVSVHFKPAK